MIDELNERVKIRLAPSAINGVGVFASRDIGKGQKLYADNMPNVYKISEGNLSKLLPQVKAQLLEHWPLILEGSGFIYPDVRYLAYMNHADEPNYDGKADLTLRDIKEGEEITEDYRQIDNWGKVYPWLL